MTRAGGDLRVEQLLPGHIDIATTTFCTQLACERLGELHTRHALRG